jgi:hypothetical protein
MSRREEVGWGIGVFAVAAAVAAWAATFLPFPEPEDVAYYVGVARNLLDGRGLVSDAIWSYATPPLTFPRPAFELWLPLPTFIAAIPMAALGTTLQAARTSWMVLAGIVAILGLLLATMAATERGLPVGRARAVALGSGLTVAVYLPIVLAAAQPDSTLLFAALVLGACLLMARMTTTAWSEAQRPITTASLVALGILLGLAAWARNEAIWLGLTWLLLASREAKPRSRAFLRLAAVPALVALAVFLPWAVRDAAVFGSPLPGQAVSNAFSVVRQDIFAWQDPPSLGRYLAAGPGVLLGQRVDAFAHDLGTVLLLLGLPVSVIGLLSLPLAARAQSLRPLLIFAAITFWVTTLVFPVVTLSGTFMHGGGAVHVLLIISAALGLDAALATIARRRGWTRPVAWLGPALAVGASLLFTFTLVPGRAVHLQGFAAQYAALPAALAAAGSPLETDGAPVISDHPIWLAEFAHTRTLALPYESPASVLNLAETFGARLLVMERDNKESWPEILDAAAPGSACFVPLALDPASDALRDLIVYRIDCP